MKTLVIVSHPYPDNSTAIKSLENASMDVSDVTVRNLESLYGSDMSKIDVAAEQAVCEGMDRIVFMFPVHWFNLTPMSLIKIYGTSMMMLMLKILLPHHRKWWPC